MTEKEKNELLLKNYIAIAISNTIKLICFTLLAIYFKKWWIVFWVILFWSYTEKKESD